MGMRTVNTQKHNVRVVISKGVFGKETFKATDNKVEINLDAAKELAEKKEFRRAKEHQAVKELAEKKEFRIAKLSLFCVVSEFEDDEGGAGTQSQTPSKLARVAPP
ncbi:hypothetical protein Tco_1470017 [Tanacetum coccineum]